MKIPSLIPLTAIVLFAAVGCNKQSPDVAKKIAELQQKNAEAIDRQRELERELEDQKMAAERDAIERERVKIEEDRSELERRQGAAAVEQEQALRDREQALSHREGKLEHFQSALEEKEDDVRETAQQLSQRDRELAGREALSFKQPTPSAPVADYRMFYDSLSSYGSWFETRDYGYVWQPVVVRDSNWRPYSRGRWVCSDRGWTWVSQEPFGWATYHYGRWTLLRGRGWIWVPGAEWAPSWVSWRENDNHIGWAPLPPETLAYRGHNWDSSVDVRFGIGALSYTFVETRHFGRSLYRHCLPVSANAGYFQQTTNITYIHINNRQVICGGPKYNEISERVGSPLPFYRLEIDQYPRPSRDSLGMRPQIKGDRLVVSAPNMDVAWNDGLKPKRIKDRIETLTVERDGDLDKEITDRYRESREEGRQKSAASIVELGGANRFEQRREEQLQDNRRLADSTGRQEVTPGQAETPELPQRDILSGSDAGRTDRPATPDSKIDRQPDRVVRQPNPPNDSRPSSEVMNDPRTPADKDTPRVTPPETENQTPDSRPPRADDESGNPKTNDLPKPVDAPRDSQPQADTSAIVRENADARKQEEQVLNMQRQAQQTEAEQQAIKRKQDEPAHQQQSEKPSEKPRDAEQAGEAQKEAQEAIKQQREQRQQQEVAQQREQEQAGEAQKEAIKQQREQRQQQEVAQQREAEQAREAGEAQKEAIRQQREQRQQQEIAQQREAEQAREAGEAQKEAIKQQRQQQEVDQQREAEQAREAGEAQKEAIRQQREQRQQQEIAQQREQERAQRQQEDAQQRQQEQSRQRQQEIAQQREQERAQRQQEDAQQRQQEQSRQRQQEEAQQREQERAQRQQEDAQQRQQEQSRQRQQEESQRQQENARQRQQEDTQRQRQQEESRQKRQDDQ